MAITLHNKVLLPIALFAVAACNNVNTQVTELDKVIVADTVASTATSHQPVNDTIIYDETIFPLDSMFQTKILTTGNFHEDEVWESAVKENWFGLFKGSNGFYLEQTHITGKRVNDPIVDEDENEKTGWEINTPKKDSNVLLIEALPFLQNRKVQHVPLSKNYIYPGDTLRFTLSGVEYKLFATGKKKKVQDDPEVFDVWNYKLYLKTTKDGQPVKQLLVAQPDFEERMTEVLFAGDIDGDGILDLIIDTSAHYNAISPTLYLSKPASRKEVVKPVGRHISVGC